VSGTGAALAARECRPELMDAPDLDPVAHDGALDGLARLNRWAGSARILAGPIARLLAQGAARGAAPLTLLDVACGAGDVPLALHATARRRGWALTIRGCDRSPVAVGHAASAAARAGADLRFFVADALAGPPLPAADIVTCSLFLHHLPDAGAEALLARLAGCARRLLLVADLRRNRAGLALAATAARLASRSRVVHADAPASVRAAFTPDEAAALARRAGLHGASVRRVFPQRWLLSWSRP
jgi:SAM-dependent methyltransferase